MLKQILKLAPVSDLIGLGWEVLKICISYKFPSDVNSAALGTILRYPCPGAAVENHALGP